MSLSISPISHNYSASRISFGGKKSSNTNDKSTQDNNPISRTGETMTLIKATFLGGMALGARLLWELMDGDFLFEHAGRKAGDFVDKNRKEVTGVKRDLMKVGATVGLLAAGISAFAILYTVLNAPKIAYKGKVNSYTKGKEMDVYIQANEAEKNIYTEMSKKAKDANDEDRAKLQEQYMQMKMAKNQVPEFIKQKNKVKAN